MEKVNMIMSSNRAKEEMMYRAQIKTKLRL